MCMEGGGSTPRAGVSRQAGAPDGSHDKTAKMGDTHVVGVVGAASSVVSIQVASLLRLFKIPQVSSTCLPIF